MINVFQLSYEDRLRDWRDLRGLVQDKDLKTKCIEIDRWWQRAPLVNHYLHLTDTKSWPDPWQLLADNNYCIVARALGICYTLLLVGIENIQLVEAKNNYNEELVLVLVEDKYILNYWPDTVESNKLSDFTLLKPISITLLKNKIF